MVFPYSASYYSPPSRLDKDLYVLAWHSPFVLTKFVQVTVVYDREGLLLLGYREQPGPFKFILRQFYPFFVQSDGEYCNLRDVDLMIYR